MASFSSEQIVEWRSLVIGGKFVHNQILMPRVAKADKHGDKVYSKAGDVISEYASPVQAQTMQVIDWATEQSVLNNLDKSTKEVFNEVKTLLRNVPAAAVVYHSGGDPCSLCPGNHYHVIVSRDTARAWDKDYRWRKIREATNALGEVGKVVYAKSQKVHNLNNIIAYLCRAPRVWMGTSSRAIFQIRQNCISGGATLTTWDNEAASPESIDALLGKDVKAEEQSLWGPCDLIVEGEWAPEGGKKRGRADEWTDDFIPPASKQAKGHFDAGKSEFLPRLIDICVYMMTLCQTCDRGVLRTRIERALAAGSPEAPNMVARLKNINYSTRCNHIYNTAAAEYRHKISIAPFDRLLYQAWYTVTNGMYDNLIGLSQSIDLIVEWISFMGWPFKKFVDDTFTVLSGRGGKTNCMFLWGASNAGKSVMFSQPWEAIMQSVGRVVQLNVRGGTFVFEGCIGRRLISIEECSISPEHVEEIKKIFGREVCQVNVKNQREGGQILPTPVIASSNMEPGYMVQEHQQAIYNRIKSYKAMSQFGRLEDFTGMALDPRAWIFLWHVYTAHDADYNAYWGREAMKQIGDELDELSRIDRPTGQQTSLHSLAATPSWPESAEVGELHGKVVVNPQLLTAKQLSAFLPGWNHWDLTRERGVIKWDHFRLWAEFKQCYLGEPVYCGGIVPKVNDTDIFCDACGMIPCRNAHEQGEQLGDFERYLASLFDNETRGHSPATGRSLWELGQEPIGPNPTQGDRVTLVPRYWDSSDTIDIEIIEDTWL